MPDWELTGRTYTPHARVWLDPFYEDLFKHQGMEKYHNHFSAIIKLQNSPFIQTMIFFLPLLIVRDMECLHAEG